MSDRVTIVVLAAVALAVLVPGALGASTRPPTGAWTIEGGPSGGSFRISKGIGGHRGSLYVSRLKAATATNSVGCPPTVAEAELVGKVKLRTFTSGGYTSWGFGRQDPKAANQINPAPVPMTLDGKRVKGALQLVWDYANPRLVFRVGVVVGDCATYYVQAQPKK